MVIMHILLKSTRSNACYHLVCCKAANQICKEDLLYHGQCADPEDTTYIVENSAIDM